MNVWPLPRIKFHSLSTVRESRPVALLVDPAAWASIRATIDLPIYIQAEPNRTERDYLEKLGTGLPTEIGVVYAVGGEAVIDAAKMIAFKGGKPLVIIPTALSSDTPFTWTAALRDKNAAVEVETGAATDVIVDWPLITEAPAIQRGAGIVEIISSVTALLDWRYASQKNKTTPDTRLVPWAMTIAAALASQAIKSAPSIGQGAPEALRQLIDLICLSVQLDSQLGHRRATHGTEHVFADVVKTEPGVSHAERVAAGILFASALHGQDPAPLRAALEQAGVRLNVIKSSELRAAAHMLADYARERDLPYSILNDQTDTEAMNTALAKSTLVAASKP